MPDIVGGLGNVRNFVGIVKEVDFDEVRGRAEARPHVVVCTHDATRASAFLRGVFGDESERHVDIRDQWFGELDSSRYDLVIVLEPPAEGIAAVVQEAIGPDAVRKLLVFPAVADSADQRELARMRDAVVQINSELTPSLGRHFSLLQAAAVKAIIEDTSKANAQFALVSNVPAVIPVIGSIVAAGADFFVLTKNQVMMVYKLAAVHHRNLDSQYLIMREMAPVVGTGFLWRTVAREAVSFLPLAAGTIPKVVIAYVGTTVLGRAADYFYRFGKKPTAEQVREFQRRATEAIGRLPIGKSDGAGADDAGVDGDVGDERRSA